MTPHFRPRFRPAPVYADLLEWHRQVRGASERPALVFQDDEFRFLCARAELTGALRVLPVPIQAGLEQKIAELLAGDPQAFVEAATGDDEQCYREQVVEPFSALARSYGPWAANTVLNYLHARRSWELESGADGGEELERFADDLPDRLDTILGMLDFEPPLRWPGERLD